MSVNCSNYSTQYDQLVLRLPAYRQMLDHCVEQVRAWPLGRGEAIGDFGAGTGNYSLALAAALPHLHVFHIENNREMIALATIKAKRAGVRNWSVANLDLDSQAALVLPRLGGAVLVNALYTCPRPETTLRNIAGCLQDSGHIYASDLGRRLNVLDWSKYAFVQSLRSHGLAKTLWWSLTSRIVMRANKRIARNQRTDEYWTHNLSEFRRAFEASGFPVHFSSSDLYRGYNDVVVARKSVESKLRATA